MGTYCSPKANYLRRLRRHVPALLLLIISLWLAAAAAAVEALQWDRVAPSPLPSASGAFGTQIPLLGEHFWLDSVYENSSVGVTPTGSSNNYSSSCNSTSNSNSRPSPWLLLHWAAPLAGSASSSFMLYGMVWPLSYTRSRRAQFIPLPQIGSIPLNPGAMTAAAASSKFFAGHIFIKPASWASLWSLHVPSATWRPLGPSRMPSSYYACDSAMKYNVSWSTSAVSGRWLSPPRGSVDDCWFSDISTPQVDEFGCPWPAARDGPALHVVNDTIILMMGDLSSADPSGDVWRLRLDADLHAHYERQATSKQGHYVYNDDQIKYLANPQDKSIRRDRLCPVKWELLTVGNHSPRLLNAPDAPAPPRRRNFGSVVVNDNSILVSGGIGIVSRASTRVLLGDIWLLQLESLPRWVRISDRISPPTYTANQTTYLTRQSHTFGIMSVRIADFLPDTASTSFQLPTQLASCINSTTPALLMSNGYITNFATKTGYIEAPWLLIPPCDVVWRTSDAVANGQMMDSGSTNCSRRSSSRDWSLYFAEGSFDSLSNWTAVPLPLRTLAGSYTGLIQYVQYAFLPNLNQLLAAGGAPYGTGVPTPTRVYNFRARTRYDAPSDFPPVQEVTQVVQDRPMMMYSSYSERFGRWFYVFGGCSVFGWEQANEMWRFNVDSYEWQLVGKRAFNSNDTQESWQSPQVSATGAFWPRWSFAPTIFSETRAGVPRFIYRFGGSELLYPQELTTARRIVYGYTVCQSGFYRFDLLSQVWTNITDMTRSNTRWTQSDVEAGAAGGIVRDGFIYPRPRCIASTIVLGDTAFLFGGNGFPFELTSPSTIWSNDLWSLNLTSLVWTLMYPGNLSLTLTQSSAALITPTMPPVTSTVPEINFPLPDGSGFGQCYNEVKAGSEQIICQSYNVRDNSWFWHMNMVGAPTAIGLDLAINLPDGRVLVVLDDYATRVNMVSVLQPRNWRWTTLQPMGSAFAPGPWQWRSSAAMVYDPDQNRCLLWGGQLSATNNSLVSDLAVHGLDMDEVYVGQLSSPNSIVSHASSLQQPPILAHDWLATLPLQSSSRFFPSGRTIGARHFASVAGALIQYQQQLLSVSCTITVLDRFDDLSLRSRRTAAYALSNVPVTLNLTLRGSDNIIYDAGMIGALECASSAHVGMPNCFLNYTGSRVISHAHSIVDMVLRHFHNAGDGGAMILVSANMSLNNVVVESSSSSTIGGALFASDSNVRWKIGSIQNSSALLSGGAIYAVNSLVAISAVDFRGNRVNVSASTKVFAHTRDFYGFGGGLAAIASTVVFDNTTFSHNRARVGGAIAISGVTTLFPHTDVSLGLRSSALSINDSNFYLNDASELGGAMYINDIYSASSLASDLLVPTVQSTVFDSNSAGIRGGAIFVDDSLLVSNDSQFRGNEAVDGGGAIFWLPGESDLDWKTNQPILLPHGILEFDGGSDSTDRNASVFECVSRESEAAWLGAAIAAATVPAPRRFDSACNMASYGPFIATAAANLALTLKGRRASGILQTSGAVVSPAVRLQVLDAYGQVVTTENSLYVSAFPLSVFAGESAVRAVEGEVVFENLILKAPPNRTTLITFTPGSSLVRYENEVASGTGRTVLPLTTSRLLYLGLQSASNSSSFAQVATCLSLCTLDLPTSQTADAVSTMLSLTFNVSMFASSSDNVLTVSYGSPLSVAGFKSFYGSDIATAAAESKRATKATDPSSILSSTTASSLTYQLPVPSTSVRLTLQTADDRVGYVTGTFSFSSFCPGTFALDMQSGDCLETRSSSMGAQVAILVSSAFAELVVLVMLAAVICYRDQSPIRASY